VRCALPDTTIGARSFARLSQGLAFRSFMRPSRGRSAEQRNANAFCVHALSAILERGAQKKTLECLVQTLYNATSCTRLMRVGLIVAVTYKVREWRLWRAMNQDLLAFRAGVHRNTISNIERGEFVQHPKTVSKIARALKVSLHNLRRMPSKVENMEDED